MSNQVKIQVPMDRTVRDRLQKQVDALGFDSIQAYFRFVAKAQIDGRSVGLFVDDWGEPSDEAAARLNKWAEEAVRDSKAGKLKSYTNVDDFLEDLVDNEANTEK